MKKYDTAISKRWIWLDWLLLVLFIGAIIGGAWYWLARSRAAEPTQKIEYVLKISGIREQYAEENGGWDALIPRDTQVTTANGTAVLGSVTAVDSRAHVEAGVRDGNLTFVVCEGMCDLYVTVYGLGINRTGDGICISDVRIAAGGSGDFRIGALYASNAAIISVRRLEE